MELLTTEIIITTVSSLLGLFLGGAYVGSKLKAIIGQIKEAVDSYKTALSPNSPGGTELTEEERRQVAEESLDVIEETVDQYGDTLVGRILGL